MPSSNTLEQELAVARRLVVTALRLIRTANRLLRESPHDPLLSPTEECLRLMESVRRFRLDAEKSIARSMFRPPAGARRYLGGNAPRERPVRTDTPQLRLVPTKKRPGPR